ncbi:Na+/H+ antiporter subunit B [Legionella tucsonensis]|uniref:Na(+)/H(+) antiporter subunit B n=1 Tax=Legionella tucsonensis TaxID=40335 RepID=A0A0W0ZPY3_9GAMM|nr:Na+/H+ antiporter subunit B [Legionella tucsonensis]KTD71207.1 Na(+)/H(+) antiporter subunit B [Legionella tucsonensis]
MKSLILQTASKWLLLITLLFSIWVLFRGHNSPGGGFIGGLIAASGFALYLLAHGVNALREVIKIKLSLLLALGFLFGLGSGLIALLQNKIFLTGIWINIKFIHVKIGSPIIFDIGVYLVVLSSVLIIMLALEEST